MNSPETLRSSPLFAHLDADALARVEPSVVSRGYGKGQLVFQQGEVARGFFIILEGDVKLRVCSGSGKEQVLHFFGAGKSFGEAAVLAGGNYPADAVTLSACRLAYVPAEAFLAEVRADPEFALQVMRSMAKRLMEFARIIENLSTREVKARLASFLLGQREDEQAGDLELPVGKGELARLLGTTAESLSRALRSLSEDGVIKVDGRRITLVEPDLLSELMDE